jgi:hypothetical protein
MPVRENIAGDLCVGAFFVDEGTHCQIGQYCTSPKQSDQNSYRAGPTKKLLQPFGRFADRSIKALENCTHCHVDLPMTKTGLALAVAAAGATDVN